MEVGKWKYHSYIVKGSLRTPCHPCIVKCASCRRLEFDSPVCLCRILSSDWPSCGSSHRGGGNKAQPKWHHPDSEEAGKVSVRWKGGNLQLRVWADALWVATACKHAKGQPKTQTHRPWWLIVYTESTANLSACARCYVKAMPCWWCCSDVMYAVTYMLMMLQWCHVCCDLHADDAAVMSCMLWLACCALLVTLLSMTMQWAWIL